MDRGEDRRERLGRYELLLELARGGMAELFVGRLHGAGGFAKLVAIKRILPHLAGDPQFKEMFLEEGRIAAHLSHPNVCQVFELDESDGQLYLAMEYLDGVSWDHLRAASTMGHEMQQLVAGVLAQAAEGLHYAHTLRDVEGNARPVVHRDISPQNLFVTVDGVCKVLDFGVAKMAKESSATKSGVIKGKLPYMAPEQIRGESLDGRADVFSLAVCAWEAIAGRRLYDRESDYYIWKAIVEEPAPPLDPALCPPALDVAIRRALERDRAQRTPSARAFAEELRAAVGGASPGQIAQTVRLRCGDRLAITSHRVASAVSARRSAPEIDPSASATVREEAGATADFVVRERSLVGGAVAVERDAGSTVHERPSSRKQPVTSPAPPAASLGSMAMVGDTRSPFAAPSSPTPWQPPPASPGTPSRAGSMPAFDQSLPPVARQADRAPSKPRSLWPFVAAIALASTAILAIVLVTRDRASTVAPSDAAIVEDREDTERSDPEDDERLDVRLDRARKDIDRANKTLQDLGLGKIAVPFGERAMLTVDSQPKATIYVDDVRIGDTPLVKAAVAAGSSTLRAVRDDGKEQTKEIALEAGQELALGTLAW